MPEQPPVAPTPATSGPTTWAGGAGRPELADVDQSWPVASSTDLHRDGWVVALRADQLRRPGAPEEGTFRRVVMEHPGAAIVLAVDERGRALCLWQYRHAAQRRFVELPAGLCDGDPDESPLEVARRELREEAQLAAATWTHLVTSYSSPGISAERMHCYLAQDLTPVDRGDFALAHEEADMVADWVAFDDLYAAALAGRLGDGPLLVCVLLARARGLV